MEKEQIEILKNCIKSEWDNTKIGEYLHKQNSPEWLKKIIPNFEDYHILNYALDKGIERFIKEFSNDKEKNYLRRR